MLCECDRFSIWLQMNMIKVSNIMGIDPKPFDPKTYVEEDIFVTDESGANKRIRLENNIVRWRTVRKPDGTTKVRFLHSQWFCMMGWHFNYCLQWIKNDFIDDFVVLCFIILLLQMSVTQPWWLEGERKETRCSSRSCKLLSFPKFILLKFQLNCFFIFLYTTLSLTHTHIFNL